MYGLFWKDSQYIIYFTYIYYILFKNSICNKNIQCLVLSILNQKKKLNSTKNNEKHILNARKIVSIKYGKILLCFPSSVKYVFFERMIVLKFILFSELYFISDFSNIKMSIRRKFDKNN